MPVPFPFSTASGRAAEYEVEAVLDRSMEDCSGEGGVKIALGIGLCSHPLHLATVGTFESERGRRRWVSPVHSTDLVPPAVSPGRLKKGAFDETLSRGPVSGPKPYRNRPILLSHKTVYHTAIYGSQKEDSPTPGGVPGQSLPARIVRSGSPTWVLPVIARPPGRSAASGWQDAA